MTLDVLTDYQRELLALKALGWGYAEIADHYHISTQSVKNRFAEIYKRLGLDSLPQSGKIAVACYALGYQKGVSDHVVARH